jgi:hypothetical protein
MGRESHILDVKEMRVPVQRLNLLLLQRIKTGTGLGHGGAVSRLDGVDGSEPVVVLRIVSAVGLRVVAEDLIDLSHVRSGESLGHSNGTKILLELLGLGGSQQHSGHIAILETPSQSQLPHTALELLLGIGCQATNLFDLSFLVPFLESALEPRVSGAGETRAIGDGVVIFASQ